MSNKFINYTVIDPQYTTPPWNADGIFQTWKPLSGDYDTTSKFCDTEKNEEITTEDLISMEIPSNKTGRGFTGNNKGFFNEDEYFPETTPGYQFNKDKEHYKMYPHEVSKLTSVSHPQDRVFRSGKRIGYNWRN